MGPTYLMHVLTTTIIFLLFLFVWLATKSYLCLKVPAAYMKVPELISELQEEMTSDVLQIYKPFIYLNHIMKKGITAKIAL